MCICTCVFISIISVCIDMDVSMSLCLYVYVYAGLCVCVGPRHYPITAHGPQDRVGPPRRPDSHSGKWGNRYVKVFMSPSFFSGFGTGRRPTKVHCRQYASLCGVPRGGGGATDGRSSVREGLRKRKSVVVTEAERCGSHRGPTPTTPTSGGPCTVYACDTRKGESTFLSR